MEVYLIKLSNFVTRLFSELAYFQKWLTILLSTQNPENLPKCYPLSVNLTDIDCASRSFIFYSRNTTVLSINILLHATVVTKPGLISHNN